MKPYKNRIKEMSWKSKLLVCLLGIGVIPAIVLCITNYSFTSKVLMKQGVQSAGYLLEQDVATINTMFSNYERLSDNIMMDQELAELFANGGPKSDSELLQVDSKINRLIGRYFSLDTIHSYALYMPCFGFGSSNIPILSEEFEKTRLYRSAVEAGGRTIWLPTYQFANVFPIPNLNSTSASYKNLFCMVKQVNFNRQMSEASKQQAPVLVINFRDSMFNELLSEYSGMGGIYAIYTAEEEMVYATGDMRQNIKSALDIWPEQTLITGKNNSQVILCTTQLQVNGWRISVALPSDAFLQELNFFQKFTIAITIILFALAILLSALLWRSLLRPLHALSDGFKTSSEGDFSKRIEVQTHDDFGVLAQCYNEMNEKISKLISENYLQKISNQQAEITALSFQLNPHFLYNCLNLINLISLTGDGASVSKMIIALSQIMRYTAKPYDGLVPFSEDYKWLTQYMTLVHYLNEGIYVQVDFDSQAMDKMVPKLLLQPFIENSVVHGFEKASGNGIIKIRGFCDNAAERLTFIVSDNGKGMEQKECDAILKSGGSGDCIRNVLRRIRLIYGESSNIEMLGECGKGVTTTISFPTTPL